MVRAAILCLLVTPLLSPAVQGQATPDNENITRFARLAEHGEFNDVWGYLAPDGREYALVGTTDGFAVVNCSDPAAPYETGYFPGSLCTWRDLKTYGSYMYVVNDCTGGVDVVDLSDPEDPQYVNLFGFQHMSHAHNVFIDTDTGMLYAVGTQSGMHVYDLNADPVDPPRIEHYTGSYIHDIFVRDGMAHAAQIYAGDYRILDVSDPSDISTIGVKQSGAEFTHSTWTTDDNSVCVAADETPHDRHLMFYDISDPTDAKVLGKFTEDQYSIPHNPFILGDYCHVSWYTEGYIVLDVSDPAHPRKVGRFDTVPNADSSGGLDLKGAWGCYPFQPSGFTYISDRARGLFVMSFNECALDLPELDEPQICRVWPDTVSALESPRQRVVLTGAGFEGATAVSVGGTLIAPSDFVAAGDQTIHFRMPLVSAAGFNDITVTTPAGTSLAAQIEVSLPSGPTLDTGVVEQPVGATMLVAMGSQPGDLLFPAIGFSELPSVIPGKVAFDIGNQFADLIFLDTLVANGAGVSGFPVIVPASGLGATLHWQVAVVVPGQGLPADVTPHTTTTIVEAGD